MLGSGPKEQLETKEGFLLLLWKSMGKCVKYTIYRSYKHWTHEGGIATPFIVHWPDGIFKDLRGSTVNQYGFLPDIMATCLDLANAKIPEIFNGNKIKNHSGKSLKSYLSKDQKSKFIKNRSFGNTRIKSSTTWRL